MTGLRWWVNTDPFEPVSSDLRRESVTADYLAATGSKKFWIGGRFFVGVTGLEEEEWWL